MVSDQELEYFRLNDPEYYNDFIKLDRDKDNAIILNEKFTKFIVKHLPDSFYSR